MAGGKGFISQVFTSNGTFTVPAGVTRVILIGCGGGAGAPGGSKGTANQYYNWGGPGSPAQMRTIEVTPNSSVSVTIGAGGTGGVGKSGAAGRGGLGTAGGSTFFGSVTFAGASTTPTTNTFALFQPISNPTTAPYYGTGYTNGQFGQSGPSGIQVSSGSNYFQGGSGGAPGYGNLSNSLGAQGAGGGRANLSTDGDNGSSASAPNYGAGGGAGGDTNTGSKGGDGGNGAPGFLYVMWVDG